VVRAVRRFLPLVLPPAAAVVRAARGSLGRIAGRGAPSAVAYAALDAMAAAREECYTYFMPPDRYAQFRAAFEGRAEDVGIGVSLSGPPFAIA
jgi:hypothetical protein